MSNFLKIGLFSQKEARQEVILHAVEKFAHPRRLPGYFVRRWRLGGIIPSGADLAAVHWPLIDNPEPSVTCRRLDSMRAPNQHGIYQL